MPQVSSLRLTHFSATAERDAYFAVTGTDNLGKSTTLQVPEDVFLRAARSALTPMLREVLTGALEDLSAYHTAVDGLERNLRSRFGITKAQLLNHSLPVDTTSNGGSTGNADLSISAT